MITMYSFFPQRTASSRTMGSMSMRVIERQSNPRKGHAPVFEWKFTVPRPYLHRSNDGEVNALHSGQIKSPMPGTLRTVECQVGQNVLKGQTLVVMEATNMDYALPVVAPFD